MTRVLVLAALFMALCSRPCDAANLCVKSGGNDNTAKGSISYTGVEATSTCWATIGRAMWGSATRTSPSASAAADADDTVYVFGATYSYSASVCPDGSQCRFSVLYNPTNQGTSGHYLTISCIGTCILAAQHWNGPAAGCSARDYVKWIADISLSYSWQITSYAPMDDNAPSTSVDIAADTGPVVLYGSAGCWAEGFVLNGGDPVDPYPGLNENYPGIRVENCNTCVVRNNDVEYFTETGSHGVGVQNYHSPSVLVEHNYLAHNGTGYTVKNNVDGSGIASGTVRYNLVTAVDFCFSMSIADPMGILFHETNHVIYQNVCTNSQHLFFSAAEDSFDSADLFNNSAYNLSGAVIYLGTYKNGTRFWNNIVSGSAYGLYSDNANAMPAASELDLEHDVWHSATTYYHDGSGNQAFATFNSNHAGQNSDDPAATTSDPRYANPSNGDLRLCTAVALPHASCVGASPAINMGVDALDLDSDSNTTENINAGAYLTGSEHIGLDTSGTLISSGPILPQFSRKLRKVL